MLSYERFVPDNAPDFETALIGTEDHIRGHLSACVDPYDDECAVEDDVVITYRRKGAGTMVTGLINADPTDEYPLDAIPVEPVEGEQVIA